MKMKWIVRLILLLLVLIILIERTSINNALCAQSTDPKLKPGEDYDEGLIVVVFEKDVTEQDAKMLVESFGFSMAYEGAWNEFWPNSANVSVEAGKEREWVCGFHAREEVKAAQLSKK